MKYRIHYYKVENLSTDEFRLAGKRAGLWLDTGIVTENRADGLREARETVRGEKYRAVRHESEAGR